MTKYAVVTDSRKRAEILFMVDRSKQRKSFWSNSVHDIFWYENKEAAQAKADSYQFNNARVMTQEEVMLYAVKSIYRALHEANEEDTSYADEDQGWDAHKLHT